MIRFIDQGSDEALVKALGKSGLVQKEVTVQGKNGTFTRKQWVKATEDKSSSQHWTKADQSEEAKKQIIDMLIGGKTREQLMNEFKSKGVTWKEHEHQGINWMRANMAINRYLTSQMQSKSKTQINKNCQIYESLDSDTVDMIAKSVDSAEIKAKGVWLKYEGDLKVLSYDYKKRAHFSSKDMGININLNSDIEKAVKAKKWDEEHPEDVKKYGSSSDRTESKFDTLFHEFYHNIDKLAEDKQAKDGKYFSETYQNGLFSQTIHSEIKELVNTRWSKRKKFIKTCTSTLSVSNLDHLHDAGFLHDSYYETYKEWTSHVNDSTDEYYIQQGFYFEDVKTPEDRTKYILETLQQEGGMGVKQFAKKSEIYKEISQELKQIPARDRVGISDIFEGATLSKVNAGYGHGNDYWNSSSRDSLALEAFANMGSAYMNTSDNNCLKVFKKWLPKSTQVFEDMLEELGKEKGNE